MCALASSFHSGFFLVVVWLKGIPATGELISITVDAVFFFALISYLTSLFICWNIISSQENTLKCCSKIPTATKHTSMPWDISFSFFFFFYLLDLFGESGLGKGENNDAITPTIFFGPNQNGEVKLDASCSKKPPWTIHEQPRDSAERLHGLTSSLSHRVLAKCTIYFAVSSLKSLRLTYNQMTDIHKQWHCVSGQLKAKVKEQQRFWKN